MALELATAYVSLVPSAAGITSKLQRELSGPLTSVASSEGDKAGQAFGSKMSTGLGGHIAKMGVLLAGLGAGAGLGLFVKQAVGQASDLGESVSKVGVVFGQQAPQILKFGDTAAAALGQSKQQALEATGTLGNLFTAMNIDQNAASVMSQKMVTLASDLASFNNVAPEEALEALRSGLVGETEPLRKFGVNLNDAALRSEAMKLGLGQIGNVLTPQQKAMASYSLILQQTKMAQGDFARTSGGLANQTRILSASFKDLEAKAGEALAPALATLAPVIGELLKAVQPVLTTLGTALAGVFTRLAPIITTLAPPVAQIIDLLGQLLVPVAQLLLSLSPVVAMVLQLAGTFLQALMPAITPLIGTLTQVVNVIVEALQPVMAQITPIIQQNAAVFTEFVKALLPILPALGQVIVALLPLLPPLLELATLQVRLFATVVPLIAKIAEFAAVLLGGLAKGITAVLNFFRGGDGLIAWLEKLPGTILNALAAVGRFITEGLQKFVDFGGRALKAVAELPDKFFHIGVDAAESIGRGLLSLIGKLGDIADRIKNKLVDKLNPAHWFSTPEEHYRMLWGAAFESIGDEARRNMLGVERSVSGLTRAATPSFSVPSVPPVPVFAAAPVSLPEGSVFGGDGSAVGGDINITSKLVVDSQELNSATSSTRVQADRRHRRSHS